MNKMSISARATFPGTPENQHFLNGHMSLQGLDVWGGAHTYSPSFAWLSADQKGQNSQEIPNASPDDPFLVTG